MNLTNMEKKVLLGYLRNPSAEARELANILDINFWSVMKARKRLLDSGILRFVLIPNLERIGAEILFSGFGSVKNSGLNKATEIMNDSFFFMAREDGKGFAMGMSKNYTDFYENLLDFAERYRYIRPDYFGIRVLPVKFTTFWRFGDFYELLSHSYGIGVEEVKNGVEISGEYSFRKGEPEVYAALLEHPDWSGEKIARYLGTSRQRILRLREKFVSEGLYRKKGIVEVKRMGYEVLLFVSWKTRPHTYGEMIEKMKAHPMPPVVFAASTPAEGFAIAVFKNFRESRDITAKLSGWVNPEKNMPEEPELMFISIQDTRFPRYFDFGGSVRNILNCYSK